MAELLPIDLADFTGGLNLRGSQFSLGDNESPEMLNIELDERSGFGTRRGWQRWNPLDDVLVANWAPRNTFFHPLSTGTFQVYVTNNATIVASSSSALFSNLTIPCNASPHLADFAFWGDTVYISTGQNAAAIASTPFKRVSGNAPVALADAAAAFNDDYTTAVRGRFPFAEITESHAGYVFTAFTREGGNVYRNRIRWSHPNEPEDWATDDFIDIQAGGGYITGLLSFGDHLLIFKPSSVWALYGYNSDSWQLIQIPGEVGAPSPTAICRTERGAIFYSGSSHPGVYIYAGGSQPSLLSEPLDEAMRDIVSQTDVWIGWVDGRLWVSVPWVPDFVDASQETSTFVYDPTIGRGAWMLFRPATGSLTSIVQGSDVNGSLPLAVLADAGVSCLVELSATEDAVDQINLDTTTTAFVAFYKTGWKYGEWPERRKSWRRPRFILEYVDTQVQLDVETYWNYNEAAAKRTHILQLATSGTTFWRLTGALESGGFDWGDGSLWGESLSSGASINRAQPPIEGRTGLGVAKSVQLRISTSAVSLGQAWKVNAIHLRYRLRRFTT